MKILVTGGAGYKGTKLTSKLLELGHKVTILDNFMYGFDPILHLVENKNLSVIKSDIRNKIENIGEFDTIFHLAGLSGLPACAANPSSAFLINVEATNQLVNSLSKNQLLIYAGTTSLYGGGGNECTEETKVAPVSQYGRTKLKAEGICLQRENSLSLRFATVFGFSPKMRMDLMVNDFTYKALKERVVVLFDSYAIRTFIHIDDVVRSYIFAMENFDKMKTGIYNVGNSSLNYSKLDITHIIKKYLDFQIIESDLKDKDVRHFIINFDKISELGFLPEKKVEEGIEELIKIFRFYDFYSHYKTI